MIRKLTLEQRIARLEKLLSSKKTFKNEGVKYKGADVNIIDKGSFGDIYDAWFDHQDLDPENRDEVSDYIAMSEDDDYNTSDDIWDAKAVVVEYGNGTKCIVVDPRNSLRRL